MLTKSGQPCKIGLTPNAKKDALQYRSVTVTFSDREITGNLLFYIYGEMQTASTSLRLQIRNSVLSIPIPLRQTPLNAPVKLNHVYLSDL